MFIKKRKKLCDFSKNVRHKICHWFVSNAERCHICLSFGVCEVPSFLNIFITVILAKLRNVLTGFEPATFSSHSRHSSSLRHFAMWGCEITVLNFLIRWIEWSNGYFLPEKLINSKFCDAIWVIFQILIFDICNRSIKQILRNF